MTRALWLVPAAISVIGLYLFGSDPLYIAILALLAIGAMAFSIVRYENDVIKVREAADRARPPALTQQI